jgi:hypothetical protein
MRPLGSEAIGIWPSRRIHLTVAWPSRPQVRYLGCILLEYA